MDENSKLKDLRALDAAIMAERSFWEADWLSLAKVFRAREVLYLEENASRRREGSLRKDILDGTGVRAMKTLGAGMHGGMTSPVRPWFGLTLSDKDLAGYRSVKNWLDDTEKRMLALLARSNFYAEIAKFYLALGTFGTAFMLAHPDPRFGIWFTTLATGSYGLDVNDKDRVDTLTRTMTMSAKTMVQMFGKAKVSEIVKRAHKKGSSFMNSFKVKHMVLPNDERTPFNMTNLNMPVASYYWEVGKTRNTFLRKSGYKMFPGAGVRWETEPGMVYGMSPAMDCLGDGRMLQSVRATYLKQEHKRADPPLAHPANVLHVNQLPGGSTPVKQSPGGGQAVYPLYQVTPDARGTLEITQDIRDAIREALYNDLFKMIAMAPQRQKTATEIAELHEEKLLLLGPVLERVHSEGFTPTIDRTFQIMVDQDMIAPPPEEIQGMPLKVEYKSILAQAQKMVSTGAVEQFMGYIGNYGQVLPDLLDIPNPDAIGDGLADYLGIDAKMLRTPKERQVIRDNRAQQAAAAQVAELANSAANTTKTLGDTPIEGGEQQALDALLGGIGA